MHNINNFISHIIQLETQGDIVTLGFKLYTDALFAIRADFKAFVTFAFKRSFGDTMAVLAQITVGSALVDIATVIRHSYLGVTFWADAHE